MAKKRVKEGREEEIHSAGFQFEHVLKILKMYALLYPLDKSIHSMKRRWGKVIEEGMWEMLWEVSIEGDWAWRVGWGVHILGSRSEHNTLLFSSLGVRLRSHRYGCRLTEADPLHWVLPIVKTFTIIFKPFNEKVASKLSWIFKSEEKGQCGMQTAAV